MAEMVLDMSAVLLPFLGGSLGTLLLASVWGILRGIDKRELRGQQDPPYREFCPARAA